MNEQFQEHREDMNKDQDKRLEDKFQLKQPQEIKFGEDGAHVAAGGGVRYTPSGTQPPPPQQQPVRPMTQLQPPPPRQPPSLQQPQLFPVQGPPSVEQEPVLRPVHYEVGSPILPRASVAVRSVSPAGESHSNVPWTLNPPGFSGNSSDYRLGKKTSCSPNTLVLVMFSPA